jgi:hypothetical protein
MRFAILVLLLLSTPAFCKTPDTVAWKEWVPVGWQIIHSATGDLNQDGKSDAVLVLEEDNPANRKSNDGLGDSVLNLNPRRLVILFQTASGYQKVVSADRFLPSQNDAGSPCLSDPLYGGGIHVNRGLLKIELHYWLSCGSWSDTTRTFSFRYENNRFRLIGLDVSEFMRNSCEQSEYSINYLTGKQKITTGLKGCEAESKPEKESKPKITWKKIPSNRIFYLDKMTSDCNPDSKEDNWCE